MTKKSRKKFKYFKNKKSFKDETRKATGFKSLRINCWEINQVTSKCQISFLNKTCKNRPKTEKNTSPSDFTYSKQSRYQNSVETDNFNPTG